MAASGVKIDARQVEAMLKDLQKGLTSRCKGARAGYFAGDINADGVSLANIAIWNEFGTNRIPPQPFLRNAQKKANSRARNIVKNRLDEGTNVKELCTELAVMMTDEIKKSIRTGEWKPNAQSTKKRKHGSKPLIDTGQLINGAHGAVIVGNENVFLPKE